MYVSFFLILEMNSALSCYWSVYVELGELNLQDVFENYSLFVCWSMIADSSTEWLQIAATTKGGLAIITRIDVLSSERHKVWLTKRTVKSPALCNQPQPEINHALTRPSGQAGQVRWAYSIYNIHGFTRSDYG